MIWPERGGLISVRVFPLDPQQEFIDSWDGEIATFKEGEDLGPHEFWTK